MTMRRQDIFLDDVGWRLIFTHDNPINMILWLDETTPEIERLVLISGLDYEIKNIYNKHWLNIYIYNKNKIDRLLDVIEMYYKSTICSRQLVKNNLEKYL